MKNQNQAYYLFSRVADEILDGIANGKKSVVISVDLNRTFRLFELTRERIVFDPVNELDIEDLRRIKKKENRVFKLQNGSLETLEYRNDGYYKLVPTEYAPTIELSGIRMHRSKDFDPFTDSELKVRQVVNKGDRVLDTCGGLGYTAIWAIRFGARQVVSVEQNKYVIKLRKQNPWSDELNAANIRLVHDDVFQYIKMLENGSFDSVIHDPPRFSRAGELYGEKFYGQLLRVMTGKGRLFHYTGNPYSARRGKSFIENTAKRLKSTGFTKVFIKEDLLGIRAEKE